MSNANDTFKTPARQKRLVLTAFGVVAVIIVGLIMLMAKGPSDTSIADDLVAEILASLSDDSLTAAELRTIGRRFEEARSLAPEHEATSVALGELQKRIENQIHQAILDAEIDGLDDLLVEAAAIWPHSKSISADRYLSSSHCRETSRT